ncbi:MAG: hypothetical protein ACE5NA_06105 [Nitrospiraceae bacterium]
MFTMILTRAIWRNVVGFTTFLLLVGFVGALISHSAIAASQYRMLAEEALSLGEEFGVVVGEVDEETREILGLQRAEGVVVYEVIGGRPADLAGIKVKAIIKEIDKVEIRTLEDFGRALKTALQTDNFTVATYEPADPENQGLAGGINFHFVRVEKQ